MRMTTYKKVRLWLLSALIVLAVALGAMLGLQFKPTEQAQAAEVTVNKTLQSGEYQTNGASMRVFERKKKEGKIVLSSTDRQGIRFHVEMGSGYQHGLTTLFDEKRTNERGSWKIEDGYKTYTLILPKRLLEGELSVDSDKVLKIDTTDYWFTDDYDNIESVAYLYDIPEKWHTDTFCFRGIVCTVAQDGTETVVASTEMSERCLADVAKMSYKDTINENTNIWGTAALDEEAAPLLKKFVPTYNITYIMADKPEIKEEVLWGDKPVAVPQFEASEDDHIEYTAGWFDQDNNVEFNINTVMDWTENKEFNLVQASAADFNLTGVADYNNFTVNGGSTGYSGVKLYATLAPNQIYTADEIAGGTDKMVKISTSAANFVLEGNGSFSGIQGVWTLLEGKGDGAQMRLIVAFDSSSMVNGDKIAIKEGAAFYANGSMYVLSQKYTIDYAEVNDVEDYGVFLGYLYNSDIKEVKNWTEPGDETRKRIRVEFRKDVFINSDFKIVYDGELPAGYTYPMYVHCEYGGGDAKITQGYYYWNNGEHTILELEGFGHHGDEILYGAPGLKIVQNGGYFIYHDAIKWENNGERWLEGKEKGTFGANSFEIKGSHATDTTEVRFTTNGNTTLTEGGMTDRWFNEVCTITVENMSESEPYAVFATHPNGTVTPLDDFKFHGQSEGLGYNHILGFAGYEGTVAGEKITILGGTRFWYESDYFTATETIIFYYNGTNWIVNNNGTADKALTIDNFIGKNYNYVEGGINKLRMHLVEDANLFNGGNGILTLESGSVKVNGKAYTHLRYHGEYVDEKDGLTKYHMIFEIIGDELAPIGQEAFAYTLVIEAGTRIWIGINEGASAQPYCVEFPERLEWRYVGDGMTDSSRNPMKYEWIRTDTNTDLDHTKIVRMYNATDAGGEVRLELTDDILKDDFYGFMVVDVTKGVPVVNGVEQKDQSFAYGQANNLIAVRGGEYGQALGDYIVIPEGSVWWGKQGSFTFVDEIYGVFDGSNWEFGFNTASNIGELTADRVIEVSNYGENEIRVMVPSSMLGYQYYGVAAIDGEAYLTKTNGTVVESKYGYWYGGGSGAYTANHSLIGFRAPSIAGTSNGDTFTLKQGTKVVLKGDAYGYCTLAEDIAYTYQNGAWRSADGWDVTFTLNGVTATVNGNAITSGEPVSLYDGTYTLRLTVPSGYAVTSVSNATNNGDGTYTINVHTNMNVVVSIKQVVQLGADSVDTIDVYAESGLTGVRINLSEARYTGLNNITGVNNYNATMNGVTRLTIAGKEASFSSNSPYSYFGKEVNSLLELRFDTANLVAGDTFTIKAGTVFNHANMAYAIEFTEDVIGYWTGSAWIANPTRMGELDWSTVNRIISYSDFTNGVASTYTIRIFLQNELFNGVTNQGVASGNVTISGTAYTGIWRYHGSGNKIVEISEWNYAQGQELVIPTGTKIFIGASYYETTKTLTATCQADGSGAEWTYTVS